MVGDSATDKKKRLLYPDKVMSLSNKAVECLEGGGLRETAVPDRAFSYFDIAQGN
jgi:hypothetical protein